MKYYFDKLSDAVKSELRCRGAAEETLLYCIKADMNAEGQYVDTYIAFDDGYLYILRGQELFSGRRGNYGSTFKTEDFSCIALNACVKLYADRYRNAARLLLAKKIPGIEYPDTPEPENDSDIKKAQAPEPPTDDIEIGRFSVGFAEKFEKFCIRFEKTAKHQEVDDSTLSAELPECPRCGHLYPDPNRRYCPYCAKRSSTTKRLFGLAAQFKKEMAVMLFFMLLSVGFGLAAPYFGTKLLYDEVLNPGGSMYGAVGTVVLFMAGFQLLSMIFRVVQLIVVGRITPMMAHKLRTDIFRKMETLSLRFFASKQSSSLMTRVDNDSYEVYEFMTDIVPYGIANIFRLAGLIILMTMVRWELAVSMFAFMAAIMIMEVFIIRGLRRHWRARDIARRAVNHVLTDALNGHRVVKAFSREKQEIRRFGGKNEGLYTAEYDRDMQLSKIEPFQRGMFSITYGAVYLLGVVMVLQGKLELGGLALLISYSGLMWEPMFFFMHAGFSYSRCVDAASRMFEIMDSEPTVMPPKEPVSPPNGELRGDITLTDVNFEYVPGSPILRHVSLTVKSGQFFGIVGKTGAGKSTIINLISRMYDVTNGEIRIDGIPLKKLEFDVLRKHIGVVSQETYLFIGSIADNIRYARPEADMAEVIAAAKSAAAHEFILNLPDGYDTRVGSGGHELSGGEKQRISIARALIQRPNILILDEATAAMDTKTERKIQVAVDSLKKGRTIIAIAHRLSTLRDADMLCVIENGEVKEQGTHEQLIKAGGKYLELHKLQAEALRQLTIDN